MIIYVCFNNIYIKKIKLSKRQTRFICFCELIFFCNFRNQKLIILSKESNAI